MDSKHEEDHHGHGHDHDHDNMNLGIGRSYECVFCKRGFNTAQALGGHMNIHRKDRARNKPPSSSSSSSSIFNYSNISSNGYIIHPHHHHHHQMRMNNNTYDHHHHQQFMIHQISADPRQPVNPNPAYHQAGFGYDQWSLINMQVEDNIEKVGRRRGRVGQEDQELDLELRL